MDGCKKVAKNYIDSLRSKMNLFGMQQKVLAKRVGIDPSHLSLIFNHKVMPSLLLYLKLKKSIDLYYIENLSFYEDDNDTMELPI